MTISSSPDPSLSRTPAADMSFRNEAPSARVAKAFAGGTRIAGASIDADHYLRGCERHKGDAATPLLGDHDDIDVVRPLGSVRLPTPHLVRHRG